MRQLSSLIVISKTMSVPFETFPLESVLKNGETILFANKNELYYAHYKDGKLTNHNDRKQIFKSLTAFCNRMSGTSINGWKACKVYRDGSWQGLQTLRGIINPPKGLARKTVKDSSESDNDADIESDSDMPPKRATPAVVKTKRFGEPILLPFIPANIIESDEPTITVESITRIALTPRTINGIVYLYDSFGKRVYNKLPNGVGDFVGILNDAGEIVVTTD